MHRERLEHLAVMLDNYRVDPEVPRFDLGSWGEFEEKRGGFLWLRKHPCDTAACAVGLACLSHTFRSEGLSFKRVGKILQISPTFAGISGWDAVKLFFDLTEKQATRLFTEEAYRVSVGSAGASAVAKRIRSMVAPRKRKAKKPADGMAVLEQIRRDVTNKELRPIFEDEHA